MKKTRQPFAWLSLPGLLVACLLWTSPSWAEVPTLVVLDFDLLEDHPDASRAIDQQRRLEAVRTGFIEGVREHELYRVVDLSPAREMLDRFKSQRANIYTCASCQVEIGKAVGARYVAAGWVQKVSNLILNINIEIREVDADRVVLNKSVDIRGNTDRSWRRGMAFMVRDFVQRREQDADYGR